MTIKELIINLQQYPEDLQVVVDGYEGGYISVEDNHIRKEKISWGEAKPYEGDHAGIFEWDEEEDLKKKDIREVLFISRYADITKILK